MQRVDVLVPGQTMHGVAAITVLAKHRVFIEIAHFFDEGALPDYELLELVPFGALPRRDQTDRQGVDREIRLIR